MSRLARGTGGLAMALALLLPGRPTSAGDERAEVPEVVGATLNDANTALRSVGLQAAVVVVSGAPEGTVTAQQPAKGTTVPTWAPVVLEVRRRTEDGPAAPKVVGLPVADAVTAFAATFDLRLEPKAGPLEAQGTVVAQAPPAGSALPTRGTLTLEYVPDRRLPTAVPVPDVRGMKPGDALEALAKAGFQARIASLVAPGAAQGLVLHQLPAGGTTARRYDRVELLVPTDGPQPAPPAIETTVPECAGSSESEAIETLRRAGLVPRIEAVEGDAAQAALVVSQEPAAGATAGTGTFVALRVARPASAPPKGTEPADLPAKVAVPELVGRTLAQAAAETVAAGLVLDPVMEPNPAVAPLRVYSQRIPAGTTVALGTLVRCRIAAPPRPATAAAVPDLRGLAKGDALATAAQAGFALLVTDVATSAQPAHRVFAQTEASGSTLAPGAAVHVSIARPQGTCTWAKVPDLSRLRGDEAATALSDAGFGAARVIEMPRTKGDWKVFAQVPAAGTIAPACQAVTLWTARPMVEGVTVPDLAGQFEVRARVVLGRENGLRVAVEHAANPDAATAPDVVWGQSPAAGRRVAAGSEVVIRVQPRPSDVPPAGPDAPPSPPQPPTSPTPPPAPGAPPAPAGTCAVRVGIVPDLVGQEREAALARLRGPSGDLFRDVVVHERVEPGKPAGTVLSQEPPFTGILIPFSTQVILTVAIPAAPAPGVRRPTTR